MFSVFLENEFTPENLVENDMNVEQWEDKFTSDNHVENDMNVDFWKTAGGC